MIRDYKFGVIVGFIFGLLTIPISVMGLVSNIAGLLGFIFRFPGPLIGQFFLIQTGSNSYSAALSIPIAIVLNGAFYAIIGGLLQKWLKKGKYVLFIFLGISLLFLLLISFDIAISSRCSQEQLDIFYEFPHYQDKSLKPGHRDGYILCYANFYSTDPTEKITNYYKNQLQENGWAIIKDEENTQTLYPYNEITAKRGTSEYYVAAQQYNSRVEVRIVIKP